MIVLEEEAGVWSDAKRHVVKSKVSLYRSFVVAQAKRFDHSYPPSNQPCLNQMKLNRPVPRKPASVINMIVVRAEVCERWREQQFIVDFCFTCQERVLISSLVVRLALQPEPALLVAVLL